MEYFITIAWVARFIFQKLQAEGLSQDNLGHRPSIQANSPGQAVGLRKSQFVQAGDWILNTARNLNIHSEKQRFGQL
jgi:hypothetical protein